MSPFLATSFGIALPAWIVDQKNSMLVYINVKWSNKLQTYLFYLLLNVLYYTSNNKKECYIRLSSLGVAGIWTSLYGHPSCCCGKSSSALDCTKTVAFSSSCTLTF